LWAIECTEKFHKPRYLSNANHIAVGKQQLHIFNRLSCVDYQPESPADNCRA
jgi:hypothetical protein